MKLEERADSIVPEPMNALLGEFKDVMPNELPKGLAPQCAVDHKIELMPSTNPPIRALYWMSSRELELLQKQLTELLDAGKIKLSKATMVHLCCSRRNRIRLYDHALTTWVEQGHHKK